MARGGNWKKTIAFIFFLLAGITVGYVLSVLCSKVDFLTWLAMSKRVGIGSDSPLVVDLSVIKLVFGFTIEISIAQIFSIILFIILFNKVGKNM